MSSALESPPITGSATPEGVPYRFHVDDFYRMIDADIFPEEKRVGLWDGQVYEKMAKKRPHIVSGNKAYLALARALPPGWFPGSENTINLSPDKAPLPDLIVLRGAPDDYHERYAGPADTGLIVELADSSLRVDTKAKLAAYAKAGIPTNWVVNLVANVVQVFAAPSAAEGRYASEQSFGRGSMIPLILDGVAVGPIAADDVLPLP